MEPLEESKENKCDDLVYKDAMLKGDFALDLFIEVLEFDDV